MYDAIVVGGGHNGLVTAAYLSRAGWRVLVLERRHLVGGACVTEEVFPGYRVSTAAYLVSLLQERVVRDLELRRFGYEVLPKDPAYFAPYLDGRHMFMCSDLRRTCEQIARFSAHDAERYPAYERFIEQVARFVEPMLLEAPPNLPPRQLGDWLALGKLGGRIMRMRPAEIGQLARMFTSSAHDVLDRWFESDELKLALATDGVIGTNGGPSSPGTAYVLLHHVMGGVGGVRGLWGFVRGGMGALSEALRQSAQAAGAEIKTSAEVAQITVRHGRATGVVLTDGAEYAARVVVSNADPRRTFLGLVERRHLPADFLAQIEGYRCEGSSFKLNLALGELPSYTALPGAGLGPQHKGTTHICQSVDAREHAWDAPTKQQFVDRAIDLLASYAPNIRGAIEHVHALSPLDLEREYGLTGGNIFHGDLSLDQLFALRPVAGWARYATPIAGLYLCGSGTHPGGGVTGAPGHNAARQILRAATMQGRRRREHTTRDTDRDTTRSAG